jgi:hypothetical protein
MNIAALTIFIAVLIVITVVLFFRRNTSRNDKTFEYESSAVFLNQEKCALLDTLEHALTDPECTPAFITQEERRLLKALEQTITERYRVFCKIRLEELVSFPNKLLPTHKNDSTARNNDDQVYYLICEYPQLNVLGIVAFENYFNSNNNKSLFKQILTSADIPVAIFPVNSDYGPAEVRYILARFFPIYLISNKQSTTQDIIFSKNSKPVTLSVGDIQPVPSEQYCPKCSSKMVKKQVTKGPHKGKFFWACLNYSSCKQLLAIHEKETSESANLICITCGADMVRLRVNKGPHTGKFFWACSAYPECRYMTARQGIPD